MSENKGVFLPEDCPSPSSDPGTFPYTRGLYKEMYSKRLWTMRQYAGFGDAKAANERYKYLLSKGTTGLSIAFDLPTQMGYDSDNLLVEGEVGKVGVAISSLEDMETVLDGLPLDEVSTSMTINATAPILLALYLVVAERRGISWSKLRGTVQNDVLKEYIARGTYAFPPKPSLKFTTDIFEFCKEHVPQWNTISISGYHIREAGSTAIQEVGLTLSNGLTYVQAAIDRGLDIDEFAPRLSFFFNVHNDFLEEVAKFRAARSLWAELIQKRYKPKNPKSAMLRFHAQTAGSTLIAQQVDTNVVRVTLQCLATVLGGAQSIHTNSRDEAIGLPTEDAATIALRTQQIIAHESGVPNITDPFGGSYVIEAMTEKIKKEALKVIETIEEQGGAIKGIEEGYQSNLIQEAAYEYQKEIEEKERIIVGVNQFQIEEEDQAPVFKIDDSVERGQVERLKAYKARRNSALVKKSQDALTKAAKENQNLMPFVLDAIRNDVTLGEVVDSLIKVWTRYRP